MRRKKHGSGNDDAEIDMTPMLDIVFIMLIFFIVTTTFSNEKGLSANRPPDSPPTDMPSKALSIRIDADGTIQMGGRIVDIRRVVANTQTYLAENSTASAAIQAHENTEHGVVVEVLDQVKQAGVSNVSILVKKGK